jgi:hypothetical protein
MDARRALELSAAKCNVKRLRIDVVWRSNESGRKRIRSLQAEPGKEPVSITPLITRDEGEKGGRIRRPARAIQSNDKCVEVYAICECVWNAKNVRRETYLSRL